MAHAPTSKHENHKAEPTRHETKREVSARDGEAEIPPALSLVPDSEYPLVRDEQIARSEQAMEEIVAAGAKAAKPAEK